MGVRGLMTLLSDDRRRFGEPWSLGGGGGGDDVRREEGTGGAAVIVYIDGPALLYHLLSPGLESSSLPPPLSPRSETTAADGEDTPRRGRRPPRQHFPVVPPGEIYDLAAAFVLALVDAGAAEIHLVLDGVASPLKDDTRLERLGRACESADALARRYVSGRFGGGGGGEGGGNGNGDVVPHPFALRAVEEAFEDARMRKGGGGVGTEEEGGAPCSVVVRRAHGEAEGCIAGLIAARRPANSDDENGGSVDDVVVLSNDTDLLVYPSVPGFVPLRGLAFHRHKGENGRVYVSGWRYLRSKLVAAFNIPTQPHNASRVTAMAAAAALAGCDYVPPSTGLASSIRAARRRVLESDIAGLRRRYRNNTNASSRATAVAALRYVGHFCGDGGTRRNCGENADGDDEWLMRLCRSAAGKKDRPGDDGAAAAEDLLEALRAVRSAYLRDLPPQTGEDAGRVANADGSSDDNDDDDTGVRLLLERGIFHCTPVVETWSFAPSAGGGCVSKKRASAKKKRHPSTKKKKRKKRPNTRCDDAAMSDGSDECRDGDERGGASSGSVWADPPFVRARRRLYEILRVSGALGGDDVRGTLLSPSSASSSDGGRRERNRIVEYRRCRTGAAGATGYGEFVVSVADGLAAGNAVLEDALREQLLRTESADGEGAAEDLFWSSLEYCVGRIDAPRPDGEASLPRAPPRRPSLRGALDSVRPNLRRVLLAALLLPEPRDALALILSAAVPPEYHAAVIGSATPGDFHLDGARERLRSSALASVACVHADILVDALSKVMGGGRSDIHLPRIRASDTFCSDTVAFLAYEDLAETTETSSSGDESVRTSLEFIGSVFEEVLDRVARKMKQGAGPEEERMKSEQLWRATASGMWNVWCSHGEGCIERSTYST